MSAAEAVRTMRAARELITPGECWTQDAWARTANGVPCGSVYIDAACWCLGGAIRKVAANYADVEAALLVVTGNINLPQFNDATGRTHAEVLDVLDRAIAETEELSL